MSVEYAEYVALTVSQSYLGSQNIFLVSQRYNNPTAGRYLGYIGLVFMRVSRVELMAYFDGGSRGYVGLVDGFNGGYTVVTSNSLFWMNGEKNPNPAPCHSRHSSHPSLSPPHTRPHGHPSHRPDALRRQQVQYPRSHQARNLLTIPTYQALEVERMDRTG